MREAIDFIKDRTGIITWLAKRQQSKTKSICEMAIEVCEKKPDARAMIVADPVFLQGTVIPIIEYIFEKKDERPKYIASQKCIEFSNGSRLYLMSTDSPERLRGCRNDFIGIDEAQNTKDLKYLLYSILFPSIITTNGKIVLSACIVDNTPSTEFLEIMGDSISHNTFIRTDINN